MTTSAAPSIAWPACGAVNDGLARFVPPLLATHLAIDPAAFEVPRQARVAVLFADIVGFTRLCEDLPPAVAMALLRDFYRRMARTIAAHGAEIDDYIGDGVMAVWGGLRPAPTDSLQALRCAVAMLGEIEQRNGVRRARPVHIGIGLHVGEAMIGNGGDGRCAKLVVLGDAVNVASRLERSTRELRASLIASDDFMRAACHGAPANVGLDDPGEPRRARPSAAGAGLDPAPVRAVTIGRSYRNAPSGARRDSPRRLAAAADKVLRQPSLSVVLHKRR